MSEEQNVDTTETDVQTEDEVGTTTDTGDNVDWKAKYEAERQNARKWEKRANADKKAAASNANSVEELTKRAEQAESELATLRAEKARRELVTEIAKETDCNAELLAKMSGDDEAAIRANATWLTEFKPLGNSYKNTPPDGGEPSKKATNLTKDEIKAMRPAEKLRAIAEHPELYETTKG